MKKHLFTILVLLILFSFGCNKDTEIISNNDSSVNKNDLNTNEVKQQQYLSKPYIILNEKNYDQTLENNVIYFIDEANLSIIFNSDIDRVYANNKISFNTNSVKVNKLEWKTLRILDLILNSDDVPESFSFILEQGLKDNKGQELEENFIINFHKVSKTIAEVKLITENEVYENNTYYHLTNTPKTFEITFSNPVDKESVEKSLKYDLNDKAEIEYDWKDNTLLYVTLDNFENGKYYFNFSKAFDKHGFLIEYKGPILFAFYINPQSRVYSLDLYTKEFEELEIKFPKDILWDYPYFVTEDKIIGFTVTDSIIVYDVHTKRIYYDIDNEGIYNLKNESDEDFIQFNEIFTENSLYLIGNTLYASDGELLELTYNGENYGVIYKIYKEQGKIIFYSHLLLIIPL